MGRYTQSPGYEKLLQADYFVDLSNTRSLGLKSEGSTHYITGLERDLGRGVSARVEGYYKSFDDLVIGRIETPAENAARVAQYAYPGGDCRERALRRRRSRPCRPTRPPGHAYGADVFLEKRASSSRDRFSGWLSYTWGRATIDAYERQYPFDYDRRHAFSVVTSWRALSRLRLAATFRAASGFPDTRPVGVRVASARRPDAVEGAAAQPGPADRSRRAGCTSGPSIWAASTTSTPRGSRPSPGSTCARPISARRPADGRSISR